jgi:hypothetical protein
MIKHAIAADELLRCWTQLNQVYYKLCAKIVEDDNNNKLSNFVQYTDQLKLLASDMNVYLSFLWQIRKDLVTGVLNDSNSENPKEPTDSTTLV